MDADDITRLLDVAQAGDRQAMDEAFQALYPHLRSIARARRRGWQGQQTLNTTVLIHEAFLKVAGTGARKFESRKHFFATLHENDAAVGDSLDELLVLNRALEGLEQASPRAAQVVDCMFFAGLSIAETAEALDISPATVKRDWAGARVWLYRHMTEVAGD
jgi:DNA-directed RNA polymerase specialized sigma24 family protein